MRKLVTLVLVLCIYRHSNLVGCGWILQFSEMMLTLVRIVIFSQIKSYFQHLVFFDS